MYKKTRFLIAVFGLLAGCFPPSSLHPIYTEKDLIFEPGLLGTWSPDNSSETWSFSAHDPTSYRLVVKDDEGAEGIFMVHLVEIDGKRFLDLLPEDLDDAMTDFFLPLHMFLFVEQIEPLRTRSMEHDWLSEYTEENPETIQHAKIDDRIVLTAPTEELQEFVLRHLKTQGAFSEPSDMIRRKAAN